MADFSFDDFLGSQEPERGNANSSAESGFSFADFLASDEEPSASSPDVQSGLEQPAPSAPQYGPGSEIEKYKQEQARIRRTADWYNRGIIGEGRKHLGTQEDGSEAFEYDAEHAPAFAPQDDEGKAIHERVKAFKGGNLGHFNRPMKIEYDEDTGKAKGYGTTKSTIVEEVDGTWSVIPTIWRDERDGEPIAAVDEQDAREHYRENGGQRFGNFKTREEAIAAAKDIHELHQRAYGAKWNQWINEHWDEVDDSVKNAEGVREAHEAWEKAGRPGIRFAMKVDGEEGGDGAAGDLPEGEQGKPMGILEHGAKSLQAATGREYGEGMAALLNVAPFARQVEGYESNRHVAALERARSGEYDDKDIEEVAKNLGPGYWEEVRPIYAVNKDDARKFLSGMAESELREITRNKKGAALDMEARPLSGWGKAVASTVENSGYVNSFIYGSVLIPVSGPAGSFWSAAASGGVKPGLKWIGQSALKSAAGSIPASVAGGMERASDLANKTYEIGENAELRVIDNNYSTLVSALKGGAGSVVENMVVEGLTDEAINIGLLGAAKLFLRYPGTLDALKGASRGLIRSGAGRALINLGRGYNALSQFTQFDSIPNEQFEEILQPIFDDVVGLGKRKGEKTDTFGEYAGKMFTSKNQADIFLGLVGTMLLQGGAAGVHAASRRFSKEGRKEIEDARRARSILIDAKADPKMVNALTDEEAMSTAEAYHAMLQNPKIAEDIANALDDRRGEIFSQLTAAQESKMNGDLADLGITPKEFTIPIKEGANGAVPDFKEQLVVNPTTGESFQGRMVVDAESGVRIVDNGAGNQENAYTVFDPITGKSLGVDNLYMAKRAADFLVANQQLYKAQDEIKLDFINDEWTKNYGDAKMFAARTIDEAIEFSKQHGVDVTRQNGFSPTRRGWRLEDGTVVLVRDNIKTPLEARQLMRHENIGHSDALSGAQWLDAGGTIGELRERNMKKVDASNPAERLRAAKESVANIVQRRMHNPTTGEKLSHAIRNGLRKLGYNLNMNDADLEVEAAKVEKAMREGKGGSIDLAPILRTTVDVYAPEAPTSDSAEPTETIETGEPNETGNRTDEAPAQPEQGEAAKPAAGEAEESVEAESPRAEASAAGVVEPEKRGESAATAKPVSERNIVEKLTDQAPVQELPVGEVFNDDSRIPNFKEGANPETGEVEPLTGEPYDLVSNPIVVMEFKDGKKVVVTGRHRLALYKRSGRKTIAARVIREADGWTVDDAKAIDAIGNIIDEKGTVKDYVNYFNNAKPTREEAKAGGFLDRPKGQRAFGIFEGATEATKSVIDWNGTGGDGLISPERAGIIAEAAPKGENKRFGAVQRILVQKALAGLRGKKLGILARSLAEEAKTRKDNTPNVGGEMQLDLFTSEDDQKLLALEEKRSDYRVKKSEEYGRIAEVLRTALAKGGKLDLNADYAKELGITDPNDKKQLAAARDKAVERANYWENAVTLDEADKVAMDAEINAKADAKAKKLAEVKAKVEAIKAKREGKAAPAAPKAETTAPAPKAEKPTATVETSDKAKAAAEKHIVSYGNGQKGTLADMIKSGAATLYPAKGLTIFDKGAHVVTIGMEQFKPTVDELPYLAKLQQERDAKETRERPPVSAPAKTEATTPAAPKKGAERKDEASTAKPAAKPRQPSIKMKDEAAAKKAKAALDAINFDTPELDTQDFDPERFGKLVTGVGKLVDVLMDSGYKDFKSLATYIYEQDPEKYGRARPVLQDIWNAVARARKLQRVDDTTAEKIYGTIETQTTEVADDRQRDNGTDGGIRTPAERGERSDGVLADRPGGNTNPAGRVDGQRSGSVPGLGEGVAQAEATGGGQEAGGGASERTGSVADSAEPEMGERETGRDSEGNGDQGGVSRVKKRANKAANSTKPNPSRRDFVMTKAVEDAILEKQTAQRVRNNLAAIRLIRELKARDYVATPDEQATLAKFVGWGGLREKVFGWGLERAYDMERSGDVEGAKRQLRRENIGQSAYDLHRELRSVLNDEEYESAKASASTAFYTPIYFVEALHDNLRHLGVKGGRFLGPSAGTGNFASAAGEYEKPVNWQFVEKDVMTGEMLKALFPNQRVTIGGFEDTKFPDGFFDFAIDNVPYADVPINDRTLSSKMFKIHDYFFAKTLAKLRPGGVMAFLTSTGTLDKTSPILRQFLTEHGGKIVGAVRLPNGFFSENAGTDVASDLVVVQKVEGRPDNSAFEKAEEYGETTEWVRRKGQVKKPLTYNGYFKDHPEQIVGKMEVASGQFGPTLKYSMPDVLPGDLSFEISKAIGRALGGVDKDALLKSVTVATPEERAPIYDEEGLRQGNVTMKDGKPFIKSGEMLEPISLPNDRAITKEITRRFKSTKSIMDGIISLRKAMRDVIDAQMADNDIVETDLAPLLAKLNDAYDKFVKQNGTLHDKWIAPFVLLDKADGNRMLALERVVKDESGKPKVVKSDIFTKRVISRGQRATKADTPKDALVISYSESGAINVPRIAELLGVDEDEAVAKLKESGDAFENPQTGRLEPSWEYLSGRVRAKLAAARAAVEAGEESYRANVEALEKVQPPMVRLEDAEIKFGATWVDPDCMKDFLRDAFGAENMRIGLGKNEVTGQWNVELGRVMNEDPWGETSWSPQEFVSRVLNHGSMNHYDTDPVDKKRYLNEQRTEANKLAAEKLHHAFSQFIQSSDKWAEPMYKRYNAVMTDMVEIKLPNNVLPFRAAGMSEATLGKLFEGGDPNVPKKGREYQSTVISRGVLGGGSLCLAHCVGAGKTLEMQSIGILGRHLGMFKKPMYVVPNHMLEQFTNEFVEAFPNANILKMSEADVKPENRRAFFAQVANGDWDAIVVKHSTFSKKLAMSDEYQKEFIEAQRRDLVDAIAAMREAGEKISVDQATKKLERLEAKLEQLANAENHDSQIVPFEELGVDQLFVDEAHNFKGMPITTRQGRTGGLSQGDSQRAVDMQMKTQYVQSLHGGDRGVVFATGTPLSNAPVVEAYVMLKYLAPNKLEEQGLKHFDDFVDAFGRITTESEFSLDGKTVKEKEKVSAFVNIPELMKLLRSVVDIVNPDQLDIPRPKPKYHMIDVDMSSVQERIMEMVAREAATPPSREERNKYLTLTRIAKNACLTPRLLGFEDGGNKIIRAVAEIKKMYDETADNRGAQLVFTDIFNRAGGGTDEYIAAHIEGDQDMPYSRGGFNLNEEIRDLLVAAGIPKEEIAIIQDIDKSKGDKDANKSALFAKVRSGEVRVLIGSRPKMGEGTNVQERLAAIHLLHPGWKPSEDEQAIGRIIRYGNTYKEGQIFYYLTKGNANIGSYETKNHQLIGVKSKLVDQVMHGDDTVREIDMDESAMDRDMLMGLASGNKALMELIDVKKRVHKLELNTESTLSSARRNKDKAEANVRVLERRREEFAKEQKGAEEWREKNDGKPFALSTPDGRTIEKVKDMADYVSSQMVRELTKDRYDREERTVLGNFNGVELVLTYDRWGDEKFRLAVPQLGVAREINYSGFLPDFTVGAMTAFKNKVLEAASPEFAKAQEAAFDDLAKQAKKMSADADKLQKDYEQMRGELVKLRRRQAELERTVTPLVVQAVEDRKTAMYGNWFIEKPGKGQLYVAQRESDGKNLSAPTVKELIPLMDAEDFASPRNAATKTPELRNRLKPNGKGETPSVDTLSVDQVNFDTPELSPAEEEYVNRVDKTPIDKDKREVFGFTKADIDHEFDVLHMKIPKHVVVHDDQVELQADALLANREYMAKLSRAVYRFGRPISAYENVALGKFWKMRAVRVNELQKLYDELAAIPKEDLKESPELAAELNGVAADLAKAKSEMFETGVAKKAGMSEVGRSLRSNRFLHYLDNDYSYAGLLQTVADAAGGLDRVPPEMQKEVKELADRFAELDEEGREIYKAKLKAFSDRVVEQIKNGAKMRRAVERRAGDEAKRVTRNYNEALVQIEIAAKELGDTLIGMADQQYPGWGKWLKWLGEFHCYENPNITEEEVVAKIVEDVRPFVENVDENQVRDALTGYGHSYKMSRYDAQRMMNDLRAQALEKVKQREMREKGTLPLATGPQRDEPSDALRAERKKTYEMKKEIPDKARDAKHLKGLLDSAKTRAKNRIADMERAIETGERIPAKERTVAEDAELRELRKRRDELQKVYDEMFKTERGMTDAQRIAAAEKAAARELELAMEDLARAQSGDFSKRPKRAAVTSDTLETLRDRVQQVRDSILELKKAKYEFGMTPEEIAALNARKIANRERAMLRQAERIQRGDTLAMKKVQPPMPPEMQKRYDELARQMKKGRQKLADMRLAALNATKPAWRRSLEGYGNFFISAQRALRATLDFSSVLRQAARITLAHPVKGAMAFAKAWGAAKSEASLAAVNEEITSDPTIREAVEKFGLHLRETDSENARDVELYYGMERSRVKVFGREFGITDIPWFGELMLKSERHYITYLNSVSAELYSSVVNDRTRFPAGATPWQKKMVADMVNVWNGSAALSNERRQALQKAGVNLLFWAPQLAVSRIQSAVGYSIWHPFTAEGVKNAQGEVDPVSSEERRTLAKIGAAEYVRSTAAMLALGWLLRWLFSDDDDEYYFKEASVPEKLVMLATPKVGNTTIDLSGGEASVYRLVYQLFAQEKRSGKGRLMKFGEYGSPTVMGTLGRFAEGKLAPWASTAVALWTGKDYVGKEFTWTDMATSLVVPLSFEDIKDQFVQNGLGKSLVTAPLTILGAGGSTYDRYPYENAVNRFREDVESFGKSAAAEIDARIKAVAKLERSESDAMKNGEPPNETRLRRIEEMRADVLRLIRSARR